MENAKWIWNDSNEVNQYVDFFKEINLANVDKNATISISADTEYALYINDIFVDCGQYDDYPFAKIFDCISIDKYLVSGINTVFITAYHQGESSMQYVPTDSGLCFDIVNFNQHFVSDSTVLCRNNKQFTNGEFYKITTQLGFGFEYEAGKKEEKWVVSTEKSKAENLSIRPIKKLITYENAHAEIVAQGKFLRQNKSGTVAELMYTDYLSHVKFSDIFAGSPTFPISINRETQKLQNTDTGAYFIVDFGTEKCGFLTIKITAKAGTILDIAYGEHLADMRVRSYISGRNFANRYICRDGEQEFTYYFKRIAGRYLQVNISNNPPNLADFTVEYIGIKPVFYPLPHPRLFDCNDALHNKIYSVCTDTLKLCMHEHYEDCPWREQGLYSSDSRNQALCGYYVFQEYSFPKASIELLIQGLGDDGYINICAPTSEKLKIPSFSMLWLLEAKEYTEFSGDLYFVEKYWSSIENMLLAYTKSLKNGLLSPPTGEQYWNFYEWSQEYAGTDSCEKDSCEKLRSNGDFVDGVYNLFAYLGIQSALCMAKIAGKDEFLQHYNPIIKQMKTAINQVFWDKNKHCYCSYVCGEKMLHYGELSQALALYTNVATEDKADFLCNLLIDENSILTPITLSYSVFKYDALIQNHKKYSKYVFDDIGKKWGYMLLNGAKTFWETIEGEKDFDYAGSLCHGWSAIPAYFYLRYFNDKI